MYTGQCTECGEYSQGAGTKACLACNRYRYLLPRSTSVRTTEGISGILIDTLPDRRDAHADIYDAISASCSMRDATILLQHYLLGYTTREIAECWGITQQMVVKAKKLSLSKSMAYLKKTAP